MTQAKSRGNVRLMNVEELRESLMTGKADVTAIAIAASVEKDFGAFSAGYRGNGLALKASTAELAAAGGSAPIAAVKRGLPERLFVEYAKSGKSECRHCSITIEKEAVRFGRKMMDPDLTLTFPITGWYHPQCMVIAASDNHAFQLPTPAEADSMITGLDQLDDEDQTAVLAEIDPATPAGKTFFPEPKAPEPTRKSTRVAIPKKEYASPVAKKTGRGKVKREAADDIYEEEEKENVAPPRGKKAKVELPAEELHCLCRVPESATEGMCMVGCDGGCDGWYHPVCCGITEEVALAMESFICPRCQA